MWMTMDTETLGLETSRRQNSRGGNVLKVLNLYAGIGGNRKLWENVKVTAVEYNEEIAAVYKEMYPDDEVIVGDAIEYLVKNWREFDVIWSSPPCQTHSKMRYLASKRGSYDAKLLDMSLYQQIVFLQHFCREKKWIVENVVPYYTPLIDPTVKLDRHLFWSNFPIEEASFEKPEVKHNNVTGKTERYGINLHGFKLSHRKDQIIRNCVNPEVGLHILQCALKREEPKQQTLSTTDEDKSSEAKALRTPPTDESVGIRAGDLL